MEISATYGGVEFGVIQEVASTRRYCLVLGSRNDEVVIPNHPELYRDVAHTHPLGGQQPSPKTGRDLESTRTVTDKRLLRSRLPPTRQILPPFMSSITQNRDAKPLVERLERYKPFWTDQASNYVLVVAGADRHPRPGNCLIGQKSRGVLLKFNDTELVEELIKRMHAAGVPVVSPRDFFPYMSRE
jgi:hypothetical protein